MKKVAALFVEKNGPYSKFKDVDLWDIGRDARSYSGPYPVICHPPCERWGRYWSGGPSAKERRLLGNDFGCFSISLWAVRTFGGVLEHPEASRAFKYFGINIPPKTGGWIRADEYGGVICCVEQGHYGHRARKATWLYVVSNNIPDLIWGPSEGIRLDEGFHSREERIKKRASGQKPVERLSQKQRIETPMKFAKLLKKMAEEAMKEGER